MASFSKILIITGVLIIVYAFNMSVALEGATVVNMQLLSNRQNYIILGSILFLSGIISFYLNRNNAANDVINSKICPFCAETIKLEAVVCRFCGKTQIARESTLFSSNTDEHYISFFTKYRFAFNMLMVLAVIIFVISFVIWLFATYDTTIKNISNVTMPYSLFVMTVLMLLRIINKVRK